MKVLFTTVLAGTLFVAGASGAAAQSDSVFTVTRGESNLLRLDVDGGLVVRGTAAVGAIPMTGAGVRMMWFPNRYAFRAGKVDSEASAYWDLGNIGFGSVAFGDNTRANGANSFAVGFRTTASGSEAVAFGQDNVASGNRSLALGANSQASGAESFALNGTASGFRSIVLGSFAQATGEDATAIGPSAIAGGIGAITIGPSIANGLYAVAVGLQNSASGTFSVAIGKNARTANRQGAVVIGDGCAGFSSDSIYPTANNQFVARGCGGIRFFTTMNLSSGVEVAPGGGAWSSISDRNRKANFSPVDGENILERLRLVPVSTWNYLTQDDSIRHLGPVAQDFYAAFGVGESDLLINTVDIDGVSLAAAQALTDRTDALREDVLHLREANAELRAENAELRERLERIERALAVGGLPSPPVARREDDIRAIPLAGVIPEPTD